MILLFFSKEFQNILLIVRKGTFRFSFIIHVHPPLKLNLSAVPLYFKMFVKQETLDFLDDYIGLTTPRFLALWENTTLQRVVPL